MFYYQLKEFDKAISTVNKLIHLKPSAHDLYMMGGALYELNGDTLSSKTYFHKSLTICNKVLDTINIKDREYDMIVMNKAINLIMLGVEVEGNQLLKKLYDSQTDDTLKELTASFMDKSKKELLESISENKYSH